MTEHPSKIINTFAKHPVAANLLMLVMILLGVFALYNLNTQFLPNFDLKLIQVTVVWPGANSENIESAITTPLEQELRRVDYLKKITSTSRQNQSVITLEFEQQTDMGTALNQVRELVSQVRNLPEESEQPVITRVEQFEPIAKIALTGERTLTTLFRWRIELNRNY